ncbi:hypothetical protein GT347_10785 [Xylophilus rhododendri]|uniref:Lipoprotein n=1 Tax=Xylophilus rhododendri TaxID=2697032 RepID=A0A857J452_9BURK|nr:hypothetical protein [Xylophilus rhododendri]QHI98437.1 hypothetical protein GT347_10785 [Xylophilus rhododendri]
MTSIALCRTTTALACTAGALLLAGCNTVLAPAPAGSAAAPAAGSSENITIEHTSLRSRTAVYESALRACKQRGYEQAIFQSQANQDATRPPATGPQLSIFTCR